ncbi:MAG: DNA cytosine methyltransferase [Paludibacteraceae bacterium]|nr:DNA cytosine methyltransferase [Paludibacteraceae bacterium]
MTKEAYKIASLFSGCGGLDLGFEQAGFRVIWANEFNPTVRGTYEKNHPDTEFILGDLNEIKAKSIPDCDGFIGGPPCQSWSVAGKQRGLEDARGKLFLTYIELIKTKKPKFFLIENVKGLLDPKFDDDFQGFINKLKTSDYEVKWQLLDAINFKVPQNRERVFIVGFRNDLNIKYEFPKPICHQPVTMMQAIGDIIEEPARYNEESKLFPNIQRANHDVLISNFGPFYYRGNRRRGWQQPSFTINATADFAPLHPSSPKMIYYGHENWNFQKDKLSKYRRLSVRECARIQTFPDNFIFEYENIKDAYKMIGNAVPPRLGNEIAKSILNALNHWDGSVTTKESPKEQTSATVLVGYYKGDRHKQLILNNKLYYVRSDGRKGSMFKTDCSIMPKYLLLHHKGKAEIYELNSEEPILADATFLKSLGFETTGETYLCFKLESVKPKSIDSLGVNASQQVYNQKIYSPYFTTIDKLNIKI